MKVLQIVSVSFSLRYFIGNQFSHFRSKGISYTVACSPSEDLYQYSKEKKFDVFPVAIRRSISPVQDLFSIWKLYRFIKRNKFDVVIAHTPKGGLIGMISSFLAGSPKRVYFRHGLVFETSKGLKHKLLVLIEKVTSYCAHLIVNVSPSIENKALQLGLNDPSKNIILGQGTCNGIDINRFTPITPTTNDDVKRKITIGFVGRLSNDKGITELVEAWKILEARHSHIELLLIGPVDERDRLIPETMTSIENSKSIRCLGEIHDVAMYYREMDIFVLPSYREGFPTVTLEASASGLPVVTTKNTGCVDSILEGKTGIFTELTPQAIADALEVYIGDPALRKEHGSNGRRFVVENFSEQIVYKEIASKILS